MVKSQPQGNSNSYNPYSQPITAETLLYPHSLTEKIIEETRKRNDEVIGEVEVVEKWGRSSDGRMPTRRIKASQLLVQYNEPRSKIMKLRWLSRVRSKRSSQFYTLKNLIETGVIDESERDRYNLSEGEDFPIRRIAQYHRVKTSYGEFLSTVEEITGASKIAGTVGIVVEDLNYYYKPHIKHELRNPDGSLLGTNLTSEDEERAIQVSVINHTEIDNPTGVKTYITPFTEQTARDALKFKRGELNDFSGGCSLALIKEGSKVLTIVKDPEQWIHAPFDKLYEDLLRPAPVLSIDSKSLGSFMALDKASREEHKQYS